MIAVLAFLLGTVFLSTDSIKAAPATQTTTNPNDKKTGYHLEVLKVISGSVNAKQAKNVTCLWTGLNPTEQDLKGRIDDPNGIVTNSHTEDYVAGGINDTVTHKKLVITLKDGREYSIAEPYVDAYSGWAGYAYFIEKFVYVKELDQWCFVGTAHYWLGTTNGNVGMPEEKDTVYNYSITKYQFVANKYTVNYNGNGADSGTVKSQNCDYDTAFSLRGNSFVKSGSTFTGWNTKSDGSGTSYSPNQSVKNLTASNGGKVTLYAQWQVNSGTIYYNANGGIISDAPHYDANHSMYYSLDNMGSGMVFQSPSVYQSYIYVTNTMNYTKSSEMNLYNYGTFHLTRTGYHINPGQEWTCGGYVFNQDSSDPYCSVLNGLKSLLNLSNSSGGAVTLSANWKANTYNIVYDGNGATSGSVATQSATYDVPLAISSNGFNRSGYKFTGWKTQAGTPYVEGQVVQNLTTDNGGTVILYAQWKAVNYTIHFDGNGATGGSMTDVIATVDIASNLPANAYTRTTAQGNSKFKGWSMKKDATAADYTDQANVMNLTDQPNTTVTLYAVWDDCPQITAVDRYFTLDYAKAGKITEEELLNTAKGTDREDITLENRTAAQVAAQGFAKSLTIKDYQANKFTSLTGDTEVIITYLATDSSNNNFSEPITVHIYSTDAKPVKEKTIRAIDWKYFNKSYEDGGLSPDSIWMTNPEYHEALKQALLNQENDTPVQVNNYSSDQLDEIDAYIKQCGGYENYKKNNGWKGLYDKFIKPQNQAK
jgi:uncharacterized repeat protein (TIGR02543 family)